VTWLATKALLETSWVWIKEHWQIPFLLVWTIIVWAMSRGNVEAVTAVMEAKKESYKKQIDALKVSHAQEIKKREELHLKYRETIATIEEEFEIKEEELSNLKKKKIKEIIKDSKDKPDEINKKIEDLFGFTRVD